MGIRFCFWSVLLISSLLISTGCGKEIPDAPPGMVYVSGGKTQVGSEAGMPHERPVFTARVRPFFMDVHPVTVGQFRMFVESTGYVTQAEDFGDAAVLDYDTRQWALIPGASWEYPLGPDHLPSPDDHPVTQVSWNDAAAYAEWAGKRLPTEIEWEHAARSGNRDPNTPYAWGESLIIEGEFKANVWNGRFPLSNSGEDGFMYTSPVGTYGTSPSGLTDMGGNVWEWSADWYRPYSQRKEPLEPNSSSEKAQRGGSFLCEPGYCHGYRVSARSHSTPESSLFHVGFRCVKDLP